VNELPTALRLGGLDWTIHQRTSRAMGGNLGLCHSDRQRIDILKTQTPDSAVDSLLHETFHAILHSQGREYGGDTEETYVRALATGLLQSLRDNPDFARWLLTYRQPKE